MDSWWLLRQWRGWLRPVVMGLYVLVLVVALPIIIVEFQVSSQS
jgi:hypothetical protein